MLPSAWEAFLPEDKVLAAEIMPKGQLPFECAQPMSQEHKKTLLFLQVLLPLPTGLLAQGGRVCALPCARDEATGKRRRTAEKTIWLSVFTTHEPLYTISLLGTGPGLPVKSGGMWSYKEAPGPYQRRERSSSKAEIRCISPWCSPVFSGGLWPHLKQTMELVWRPWSPRPVPQIRGTVRGNWSCSPTSAKRLLVTFPLYLFFPGLAINSRGDSEVRWQGCKCWSTSAAEDLSV